ncbi:MAG: hypothetical protein JWM74_454 [Myxococcaceae bacterium]|jgi:hypothetical protein|nr:hypothetical protein [Myxococcaceae bacterium]
MHARPKASIELRFTPNVELVSDVRKFISVFYEQVLGDAEAASRLALTTHELLENVVKYSTDGETRTCLDVEYLPKPRVTIRTYNRTSPDNVAALERLFGDMKSTGDPSAYYLQVAHAAARGPVSKSGLGLARICAEADMILELEVLPDGIMIQAHVDLDDLEGAA